MRRRPLIPLAALIPVLVASAASAGALYTISFDTGDVSSATGFRRDTSFALPPSYGTGDFTGHAYSGPGQVETLSRVDCNWYGGYSGAFGHTTRVWSRTDDFLVTGPAGPTVPGTLHFRVRADLERIGGYAGNNGHGGSWYVGVGTGGVNASGQIVSGNYNTTGYGWFASVTSPSVDMVVDFSANFPVGTPFSIQIYSECSAYTYGNSGYGMSQTNGGGEPGDFSGKGIQLEAVGGQAMTLPAGYTFNSPGWGIVNNTYPNLAGVGDGPRIPGLELALAGPNPSSGESRAVLSLPREAGVRVELLDVAGRLVRTLLEGRQLAGAHSLSWDGRDREGAEAPSGVYFLRAEVGGRLLTHRIVRTR